MRQTDIKCVQTDLESISADMAELAEAELVEVELIEIELIK
jgi:hypothetical protein